MKNIMVVADKKLGKFARQMVHGISKIDDFDAVFLTVDQYRDNEIKTSGKNHVIFIGENKISEAYKSLIKVKYNEHGIIWGYDSTKALIYVKEDLLNKDKFKKDYRKLIKRIKENKKKAGGIAIGALAVLNFFMITIAVPLAFDIYLFKNMINNAQMKKEQYRMGIMTFLEDGFEKFINGED